MTKYEMRNLPIEERVKLPEVKNLISQYVNVVCDLHDLNLRIIDFMRGGADQNEIVVFHDGLSHKPILIDYSKED